MLAVGGVCAGVGADRRRDETSQAEGPSLPRGCPFLQPFATLGASLTRLSAAAGQVLVRPPLPKGATLLVRIYDGYGSLARHPREAWWVHFRLTTWRCHSGERALTRQCDPTSPTKKPVPGRPRRPPAPDPSHGNEPRRESLPDLARPDAGPHQAPWQPRGKRKQEQHGPRRRQ
jgi:hypothetical protein